MGHLKFKIIARDKHTKARTGLLELKHGIIKTPEFMPVATKASVKALTFDDLIKLDTQVLICNTYHLMLNPGAELIEKYGGLHGFMHWDKPILTDSGGFQVFSLGFGIENGTNKLFFSEDKLNLRKKGQSKVKITDDGVYFKVDDGKQYFLTPEKSIEIQEKLGADMILAFDECTCPTNTKEYTAESMERTHSWALRCMNAHKTDQALVGIIQGGEWQDLREKSARYIASLDFDGYAIGGSLGNTKDKMNQIIDWVINQLPEEKPRHLLGIGVVEDIFEGVERGIDLFDCVTPTRQARFGYVYVRPPLGNKNNKYNYKLTSVEYAGEFMPLDSNCTCNVCAKWSRDYIKHLYKSSELLAYNLISYHNLHFFLQLMREIRNSIENSTFLQLKKEWEL